ncbi:MAG: hypothetical protein JWL77_4860 [Chthonomonadaceae bacterium]|nr:hypothetical protein [Chthonomonadaceae bacterium]
MVLFCKILIVIGILMTLFKLNVVWYVSRDPYGGGGVPTSDFILFYPAYLAFSIDLLLDTSKKIPFWGFGFVLYIVLLSIFFCVYLFIFATGDRVLARERELARKAEIKESVSLVEVEQQQERNEE